MFSSRLAIACSICVLVAAFLVLPVAFWVLPAAILVLGSSVRLRRVVSVVATLLLLIAAGGLTLLAASPHRQASGLTLAAGCLVTGLLLAAFAALVLHLGGRLRGGSGGAFAAPGAMSEAEYNAVCLMRLTTATAFASIFDPSALRVTWLEEAGLLYLVLISAAGSWPRASAGGAALVGTAVFILGSAVLFVASIDGGPSYRRLAFRIILTLFLHWTMVASAIWRFAAGAKREKWRPSGGVVA